MQHKQPPSKPFELRYRRKSSSEFGVRQLPIRQHKLDGEVESYTTGVNYCPINFGQMVDSVASQHIKPCRHASVKWVLGGYIPEDYPSAPDKYVDAASFSGSYTHYELPTRYVLVGAISALGRTAGSVFTESAARFINGGNAGVHETLRATRLPRDWWENRYFDFPTRMRDLRISLNAGEFSFLNFLLELKDVKSIVKGWGRKRAVYARLRRLFSQERDRDRVAVLANEWLAESFGTVLFARDVLHIWQLMLKWQERADALMDGAGKLRTIQLKLKSQGAYHIVQQAPLTYFDMEPGAFCTHSVAASMTCSGMVYYKYAVPEFKGFTTRLAQLCDAYGISLDPGIVWNAIPLSFVVDWFVNVGEWLHAQRIDNYGVDVTYLGYTQSAHLGIHEEISWTRQCWPGGIKTTELASVFTEIYERRLEQMPESQSVQFTSKQGPWRPRRIINAAALLAQRWAKWSCIAFAILEVTHSNVATALCAC